MEGFVRNTDRKRVSEKKKKEDNGGRAGIKKK